MMARIRKSMADKDQGFTLIELLVVMIIIGILAAIAIPLFLNQRKKAQDTATKSDVTMIGHELATYFVDGTTKPTIAMNTGTGFYELTPAGGAPQQLGRISQPASMNGLTLTTGVSPQTQWCVSLTNTAGDKQTWKYSAKTGLQEKACTAADVS